VLRPLPQTKPPQAPRCGLLRRGWESSAPHQTRGVPTKHVRWGLERDPDGALLL
jgi:hypothetical protein